MGVVKAQTHKKMVPVVANLYVTGRCNATCTYCYVEINKKPKREFSLQQWKKLVDDLYVKGTRLFALVGGEPLLYPKIDELAEHIISKNVYLNLATNGFLLDKHLEIARMADEVSISLDGDLASHNLNRGNRNFERTMKGIDTAIEAGCKVRLCTVVTRHNADMIDYLVDFAEERNIFVTFTPLIDAPDLRKDASEQLRLSDEEIREFFLKLKEVKKKSSRIINSFANMDYMINYPVQYGEVIWKNSPHADYYPHPCPYGRFQFLISSVGEIFPCGIMWNNDYFEPKNVLDVGLDEALEHASQGLKCQSCSFANSVDWNNVTSLPWLWYGVKMTVKQSFGKRKIPVLSEVS